MIMNFSNLFWHKWHYYESTHLPSFTFNIFFFFSWYTQNISNSVHWIAFFGRTNYLTSPFPLSFFFFFFISLNWKPLHHVCTKSHISKYRSRFSQTNSIYRPVHLQSVHALIHLLSSKKKEKKEKKTIPTLRFFFAHHRNLYQRSTNCHPPVSWSVKLNNCVSQLCPKTYPRAARTCTYNLHIQYIMDAHARTHTYEMCIIRWCTNFIVHKSDNCRVFWC